MLLLVLSPGMAGAVRELKLYLIWLDASSPEVFSLGLTLITLLKQAGGICSSVSRFSAGLWESAPGTLWVLQPREAGSALQSGKQLVHMSSQPPELLKPYGYGN